MFFPKNLKFALFFLVSVLVLCTSMFVFVNASSGIVYQKGEVIQFILPDSDHVYVKFTTPSEVRTYYPSEDTIFLGLDEVGAHLVYVKSEKGVTEYSFEVVEEFKRKTTADMLLEDLASIKSEQKNNSNLTLVSPGSEIAGVQESINTDDLIIIGQKVKQVENLSLEEKQTFKMKVNKYGENFSVFSKDGELDFSVKESFVDLVSNIFPGEKEKSLIVRDAQGDIQIEYYLEGPEKKEKNISRTKKEVEISSDLHYENVLAFTNVEEEVGLYDADLYQVYWKEENKYRGFIANDTNGNGLIDQLVWIVPHLSTQTFEIIKITKAEHLDLNKNFIEDIFGLVKEQDDVWFDFPSGDFVKVSFEKNLTNEKDITVYAKANSSSSIEIYPEYDSSTMIAEIVNIAEEGFYQVILENLIGIEDTFYLRAVGDILVDLIIDPTVNGVCISITSCTSNGAAATCTCAQVDTSNTVYAGTGLTTKSGNLAEVVINLTNTSLIPSGSLISDADIYVEMVVDSGMSTCTIDYQIGAGSWNSLDSDCTDETTISLRSWDVSSLTESDLESLSVRVNAVKTSGKGAPLSLDVDYVYVNVTYAIVGGALSVNLTAPDDDYETSTTTNQYNYTPSSSSGDYTNCTLWDDTTGSFSENKTNSSTIVNATTNSFSQTISTDGVYLWNVQCCDVTNGCAFAPLNRTIIIDTTAPTVTSLSPANDSTSSSLYGVDFIYNVSDARTTESCSLILDGSDVLADNSITESINQTISYPVSSGVHIWAISCIDTAGNVGISGNRTINVSFTPQTYDARWYETSTSNYTSTGNIFLANTRDGTENQVTYTVPSSSLYTLTESVSPFMVNNGALIGSGTVSFSGYFTTSSNNKIYITWKVYVTNSSGDTLICQYGDDSTGHGNPLSASETFTGSCNNPSDIYLSSTDRIKLVVNAWNDFNADVDVEHFWDDLHLSYVEFNTFSSLGDLTVDMTYPATDLNINTNEDFNVTCFANCSAGDCLNTNLYVQQNTSGSGWTNIGASGNLVLGSGETNPHNIGTVNTSSNSTNFTITGNLESINNIRCIGQSDYSDFNGTTTKQVTVTGVNQAPETFLISPGNATWEDSTTVDFIYNVSDFDDNLEVCSLYLDGSFNMSNQTVLLNNQLNNFTVSGLSQGTHTWYVNCTDDLGANNVSSTWEFYVDSIFPNFNLHNPADGESLLFGDVTFNFTVVDNLDNSLTCDLVVDGAVEDNDFSALNGSATERIISGLSSGLHLWNVTCWDEALNTNTSETRNFTLTDSPPTVFLTNPSDNFWFNTSSVDLFYNVTDDLGLTSCSLYVNGIFNQTNSTPVLNNQINNFSLTLGEGAYNWTVNCTDTSSQTHEDTVRDFYVDLNIPTIELHTPLVDEILGSTSIDFNFTVTDSFDDPLTCDLVVDGVVEDNDFSATSGISTVRTVSGLSLTDHLWNVTCWDDALNANSSETRNFTIADVPPVVNLTSPADNFWTSNSNIDLFYNVSDEVGLTSCSLYINGIFNQTNSTPVLNNQINNFSLTLGEGAYNWTVNCTDTGSFTDADTVRDFFIDWTSPTLNINSPADDEIVTTNNVTLNFTIADNLDSNFICNISDTEGFNYFEEEAFTAGENLRYLLRSDGDYLWDVSCIDTAGNGQITAVYNFSVVAPPIVTLNSPEDNFRTIAASQLLNYTPEDAIGITSCTLYWDGVANETDIDIEPNEPNFFTYSQITEGLHNWTVSCIDSDVNVYAPTARDLVRDITPPTIDLILIENDSAVDFNDAEIIFRWKPTDALVSEPLRCDLYIDEVIEKSVFGMTSGAEFSWPVSTGDIGQGYHNWSVSCNDVLNNANSSETRWFNLTYPDFHINDTYLFFNNTEPREGDPVLITAQVFNLEGVDVEDVIVRFYDGEPGAGGVEINSGDVDNISRFNYTNFTTIWTADVGTSEIWVVVDPADTFTETNELNNNVSYNITVGSWYTLYGDIATDSELALADSSSSEVITWLADDFNGGNLYVTDYEASISWLNLQAIGRDETGGASSNDFEEIDTNVFMTGYLDSVYNEYTTAGVANDLTSFITFTETINNVPIINSTNNSNFVTGILWDTTDTVNTEYDSTEDEDLVFVANVNNNVQGKFGIYDYEVRVPATLREYDLSDSEKALFYVELI